MRYIFLGAGIFFTLTVNAQDRHGDTIIKDGKMFTYVEKMPEPGYDINKYFMKNFHYPDYAYFVGKVIVQFIVNEDGTISDCHVVKGKEIEEEVLRVIRKMPKWKPGMRDGKPVKVCFTTPIIIDVE